MGNKRTELASRKVRCYLPGRLLGRSQRVPTEVRRNLIPAKKYRQGCVASTRILPAFEAVALNRNTGVQKMSRVLQKWVPCAQDHLTLLQKRVPCAHNHKAVLQKWTAVLQKRTPLPRARNPFSRKRCLNVSRRCPLLQVRLRNGQRRKRVSAPRRGDGSVWSAEPVFGAPSAGQLGGAVAMRGRKSLRTRLSVSRGCGLKTRAP